MKISGRPLERSALAAAAALALLAERPALAQQTDSMTLEEIIVTAQKRKEALAEVPQSVTVVGEATLERLNADSFQDYLALIPGISFQGNTPGAARITLRGINTGGVASTVSTYVDEVPFGSSTGLANGAVLAGDFDTFDVTRLEVLRGPQGTLYGASSLGGVLKFVTNVPNTERFEAATELEVEDVSGGGLGYSAKGMINIPLGERFAIRASGFYRYDDGFIDSIGNNPIRSLTNPNVRIVPGTRVEDNIDQLATYGGRVSALFEASDALSVRLTALMQNLDNNGSQFVDADPITLQPLYGGLTQSQYHDEYTDTEYRIYSATVDWDVSFASLVAATSYSTLDQQTFNDFDPAIVGGFPLAAIVTQFFGNATTRPLGAVSFQEVFTDKFTQELRLSSPESESFEWLFGAYYAHESSGIDPQDFYATEAGTDTVAAGVPVLIQAQITSKYDEYAAFANATWHITPRFDLTFGARGSRNEQSADLLNQGQPLLVGAGAEAHTKSSEDVFTYSVAPRYELGDNVSVYARLATGYRPGGPNTVPFAAPASTPRTFESDSTVNYEIGLKGDWLDRALSLEIAAFRIDWEDIQLLAVINNTGVNTNGGKAFSQGIEFSAAARPTRGLTFSLNGAYTEAELKDDTPAATSGREGEPLPFVPDWSMNLNADYEWSVFANATAYVGATLSYVGERTTNFNVRVNGELVEVPSYQTIDLRAGIDVGRWSIGAYVRNLDDEYGITSLGTGGLPNGAAAVGVIRPRTFGLTIRTSF